LHFKRDDPLFFLSFFQQFPFGTIGEERETGTLASGRFGTFSREGGERWGELGWTWLFGPFCQTVMDGRRWEIDKNPSEKEKKLLPKIRRRRGEIKSGVCRNRLETFVDPTVVDVRIYLRAWRNNTTTTTTGREPCVLVRPYWTFPYFHSDGGFGVLIR
jgi:hypothetical protein